MSTVPKPDVFHDRNQLNTGEGQFLDGRIPFIVTVHHDNDKNQDLILMVGNDPNGHAVGVACLSRQGDLLSKTIIPRTDQNQAVLVGRAPKPENSQKYLSKELPSDPENIHKITIPGDKYGFSRCPVTIFITGSEEFFVYSSGQNTIGVVEEKRT